MKPEIEVKGQNKLLSELCGQAAPWTRRSSSGCRRSAASSSELRSERISSRRTPALSIVLGMKAAMQGTSFGLRFHLVPCAAKSCHQTEDYRSGCEPGTPRASSLFLLLGLKRQKNPFLLSESEGGHNFQEPQGGVHSRLLCQLQDMSRTWCAFGIFPGESATIWTRTLPAISRRFPPAAQAAPGHIF